MSIFVSGFAFTTNHLSTIICSKLFNGHIDYYFRLHSLIMKTTVRRINLSTFKDPLKDRAP